MFDETINGSIYPKILSYCDKEDMFNTDNKGVYKQICKKLARNLLLLADSDYEDGNFSKHCDMLYIWMYFKIEKKGLFNSIFEQIFQQLVQIITEKLKKKSCSYFSFNKKLQEPEELIKLRIFEHNTSTFQNILKNINEPNNCSCLEYVYDCINVYNDMSKRFCATDENKQITYKDTCDILNNFYTSYSNYIRNINREIYEFPILSDTSTATHTLTATHLTRCSSNNPITELGSNAFDQSSSTKQISISTALSTMAGIPPFLALIYKFTPVGTWFRSKTKKDTDVFKNLDEEREKEIYYPRHENAIVNSSKERYNVAYEQI